MVVVCINNGARPNEVPTSRWLVKDREYTIIKIMMMRQQGGIAGVKLAELNNDDLFPYTYFRLDRFGITKEEIERIIASQEIEVEYV